MFTQALIEAISQERRREIDQFLRERAAVAARPPQATPPRGGLWRQPTKILGAVDLAPSRSSYS